MQAKVQIIFLSLILFFPRLAKPVILETFGDSLTHGIMARTSVENSNPTLVSTIMSDITKYGLTKDLGYVERYGNRGDAWPTYLKDELQQETAQPIQVENHAVLGHESSDLEGQVKQIQFSSSSDVRALFFIGHNDLCPSLDQTVEVLANRFETSYRKALKLWDSLHDGATAYILPVGNVDEVFTLLNQYVWFEAENGDKFKCNDNWGLYFPYCRKFGVLAKQGKIKEVLRPRLNALNRVLSDLVEEMGQRSSKNRFRFLRSMSSNPYVIPYFAVDCFHLSSEGQRVLAHQVKLSLVN